MVPTPTDRFLIVWLQPMFPNSIKFADPRIFRLYIFEQVGRAGLMARSEGNEKEKGLTDEKSLKEGEICK